MLGWTCQLRGVAVACVESGISWIAGMRIDHGDSDFIFAAGIYFDQRSIAVRVLRQTAVGSGGRTLSASPRRAMTG
jgi:hypothetical protein